MNIQKSRWHVEKTCSYACRTINTKLKLRHLIILKHKNKHFLAYWDKDASIQGGTGRIHRPQADQKRQGEQRCAPEKPRYR